MKNKKIILGLGTITALGAMSMGFVACVKEKDLAKYVKEDELLDKVEFKTFERDVNNFFKKTGTDEASDPKIIKGDLPNKAKVSDLIEKVETDEFNKKFKIDITDEGKKKGLSGTKHKLMIKKIDDNDKDSKLKVEVEFTFKIATAS